MQEKKYFYAGDFPEGSLRELLAEIAGHRGLLTFLRMKKSSRQIAVLNSDEKTVSRVSFSRYALIDAGKNAFGIRMLVELQPIKGYEKENEEIKAFMIENGFKAEPQSWSLLEEMLSHTTVVPGGYSSKINVELSNAMNGRDAALAVIRSLLDAAQKNIWGVKEDIDTEFLHDFRVSIRRLRTLLGQFKKIFPDETVESLRANLSYLGRLSNKTRDLDVYLARKKEYYGLLPETLRDGLDDFFKSVEKARRVEFSEMLGEFDSPRFADAFSSVARLIASVASLPETENSHKPVKYLAGFFILRKFKKILVQGSGISEEMTDEELHRLRISCKHLRYLIEFFSSLFPEKEIGSIVAELKCLQEKLGIYNDLSVQMSYMQSILSHSTHSGGMNCGHAAALGGLIVSINADKIRKRESIESAFKNFCSKGGIKRIKSLFALKTDSPC